jgi:hypothetical protein
MDINPQSVKPISDDQELAKVLAGVNQQADEALQFETTPVVTTTVPTPASVNEPASSVSALSDDTASLLETPSNQAPTSDNTDSQIVGYNPPTVEETAATDVAQSTDSTDLSDIKKEALHDLRPLVDKLDGAPDEKFDTYLLLIRSTDDKTLVSPAYTAARAITDESRRAQALLDIIKEIDYLSNLTS